jgi:Ser/Thr protein kinase RdoA (MazF antagonist)
MGYSPESQLFFRANNHSKFEIGWRSITTETNKEINDLINRNYSIGQTTDIKQVDEWERMSNNYQIATRQGVEDERYLLRRNINLKDPRKLEAIEQKCHFLRENGIPIPQLINTVDGKLLCESGGYQWQLYEFVEGHHYRGTEGQLVNIATNISLLHLALAKLPDKLYIIEKNPWHLNEWEDWFDKAKKGSTSLDMNIFSQHDYVVDVIKEINDGYDLNTLSRQAIHGDLHPHNTIFQEERMVALLDFADVRFSERSRDCGNACHRFSRQRVVHSGKPWKHVLPYSVNTFMNNYLRNAPMSDYEIALIPVLIKDEIIRKLHLDINLYYSYGEASRLVNGEFEKKINLLKESDIIGKILTSWL